MIFQFNFALNCNNYGYNNPHHEYQMYDVPITPTTEEKDLGVNLKSESHISSCVVEANKILGMIKRAFSTRRADVLLKLYKFFVRPHLEYAVPPWYPSLLKDIKLIEGIQRRCTKLGEELNWIP